MVARPQKRGGEHSGYNRYPVAAKGAMIWVWFKRWITLLSTVLGCLYPKELKGSNRIATLSRKIHSSQGITFAKVFANKLLLKHLKITSSILNQLVNSKTIKPCQMLVCKAHSSCDCSFFLPKDSFDIWLNFTETSSTSLNLNLSAFSRIFYNLVRADILEFHND